MAEHILGHARQSQQAPDEIIATDAQHSACQIADVYAWRGDTHRAFEWLDRAYRLHDPNSIELNSDPPTDSLRDDARYAAILA